jgi:hypothetical protein
MAARIAIFRDRLPDLIAGQNGPAMLETIVDALTDGSLPTGVYTDLRVSDAAKIIAAAREWVIDGLQSISDEEAAERIEADRAAAEGPMVRVAMDRLAERIP